MFRRPSEQDYYQILEIDRSASSEEVQTAFERAREIYGSDSLVSGSILTAEERREILRRVKEAYNTLIAEDSRRLYDESLLDARESEEEESPVAEVTGEEEADRSDKAVESSPRSYPRLVKGAQSPDESLPRSKVQLGFKEEASGDFLRRARESAGLNLRTIAEETKIGVTMLSYIEEERTERFPAMVYLKSFISQYAQCLGLDAEKVARTYLARIRRLQSRSK